MANQSDINVSTREFVLNVPKELALFSIGFTIDAGGSATKLVYRSKEDYQDGRPKDPNLSHGKLRLRFFGGWLVDSENVVEFIRKNVDVQIPSPQSDGAVDEWLQTGLQLQFGGTKLLDTTLGIKTKLISEFDAIISGLYEFSKDEPLFRPVPFSIKSMTIALNETKGFIQGMMSMTNRDASPHTPTAGSFDMMGYVKKIMSSDPETMAAEFSSKRIEYPCLYVLCGSAVASMILHENGKYEMGDMNPIAGKTFIGEGRALTGAKGYNELIEMASRGNHTKVDIKGSDMKNTERAEKDWYSGIPEDMVIFTLGKMAEEKFDGTYTKDDVANGLLQIHCSTLARFGIKEAKLRKVKSIVYGGSFVTLPIVRESLERWFLSMTMSSPFIGDSSPVSMHILPNPGFVVALGVWHKNLQLQRDRQSQRKTSQVKPSQEALIC